MVLIIKIYKFILKVEYLILLYVLIIKKVFFIIVCYNDDCVIWSYDKGFDEVFDYELCVILLGNGICIFVVCFYVVVKIIFYKMFRLI